MTTLTRNPDSAPHAVDPAADMLRNLLGDIQPRNMDDLLDLAGLVGEIDGGPHHRDHGGDLKMVELPKNTRASSVLTCEGCGTEAQLLGEIDGPDGPDQVEMWNWDHADCATNPVLNAWQLLAHGGDTQTMVDHGDDLRNLTTIPRPSWAPVERDSIRGASWSSAYRSRPVAVALSRHGAEDCDNGQRLMSRLEVSAKRLGQGDRLLGVTVSIVVDSEWKTLGVNVTLDEARNLMRVIEAAIDLAVTE